jgi:hypothetical protein
VDGAERRRERFLRIEVVGKNVAGEEIRKLARPRSMIWRRAEAEQGQRYHINFVRLGLRGPVFTTGVYKTAVWSKKVTGRWFACGGGVCYTMEHG